MQQLYKQQHNNTPVNINKHSNNNTIVNSNFSIAAMLPLRIFHFQKLITDEIDLDHYTILKWSQKCCWICAPLSLGHLLRQKSLRTLNYVNSSTWPDQMLVRWCSGSNSCYVHSTGGGQHHYWSSYPHTIHMNVVHNVFFWITYRTIVHTPPGRSITLCPQQSGQIPSHCHLSTLHYWHVHSSNLIPWGTPPAKYVVYVVYGILGCSLIWMQQQHTFYYIDLQVSSKSVVQSWQVCLCCREGTKGNKFKAHIYICIDTQVSCAITGAVQRTKGMKQVQGTSMCMHCGHLML